MRLNARLDELMRLSPAHEAGVKLQRMIKRTRQYLFVFVTNRDVPATNNGSERIGVDAARTTISTPRTPPMPLSQVSGP